MAVELILRAGPSVLSSLSTRAEPFKIVFWLVVKLSFTAIGAQLLDVISIGLLVAVAVHPLLFWTKIV